MIHVDVCLPAMHREIECLCDERLNTAGFIREIIRLVNENEYSPEDDFGYEEMPESGFCLCDLSRGILLNKSLTLSQNRVFSGHRLILI